MTYNVFSTTLNPAQSQSQEFFNNCFEWLSLGFQLALHSDLEHGNFVSLDISQGSVARV